MARRPRIRIGETAPKTPRAKRAPVGSREDKAAKVAELLNKLPPEQVEERLAGHPVKPQLSGMTHILPEEVRARVLDRAGITPDAMRDVVEKGDGKGLDPVSSALHSRAHTLEIYKENRELGFIAEGISKSGDAVRLRRMDAVIEHVLERHFLRTACALAGTTPECVRNWCAKGKTGLEPYATFALRLEAADAQAQAGFIAELLSISDPVEKGKNLRWFGERRWKQELGETIRVEVVATDAIPRILDAIAEVVDDQTFDRICKAIENVGDSVKFPALQAGGDPGPGHANPALVGGSSEGTPPVTTSGQPVD